MRPVRHPCRQRMRRRDWVSVLIMIACLAGLLVPVILKGPERAPECLPEPCPHHRLK